MTTFRIGLLFILCAGLFAPDAKAVDIDGDGLLDLVDLPLFDPNATGSLNLHAQGIQDLDGANQLTNLEQLLLGGNQIANVESGDFDG